VQINFILLVSRQGKTRLTKWFVQMATKVSGAAPGRPPARRQLTSLWLVGEIARHSRADGYGAVSAA
jgi:hypothetical protein